ncbi:ArnT family glycosyltransferase, partial [Frankia nepalensis]
MSAGARLDRLRAWVTPRSARIAAAAAAAAFVLVTGLGVALGDDLRFFDEQLYVRYADHLVADHTYSMDGETPSAYRPPAYPFLLAAFRLLDVGVIGLRIVNALLFALGVYGIYLLGRRLITPAAGALAAVLSACYPPLVYTSANLYPQALSLALIVGLLLAALRALDAGGWRAKAAYGLAGGLALGALALAAPSYGAIGALLVGWLVLFRRRAGGLLVAAALVVAAAVLPAAWVTRNLVTLDAFVPVSTNDGYNLLLGNNPQATPTSGDRIDVTPYLPPQGAPPESEVEQSRRFRTAAVDWVGDNPGDAAWLYLGKLANHYNITNEYSTSGVGGRLARDALTAVVYLPLLALFLVRVAAAARGAAPLRRGEGLLLTIVVGVPFPMAVYTTRIRYRLPLDCLMFLVALGLAGRSRDGRAPAAGAVAVPSRRGEGEG